MMLGRIDGGIRDVVPQVATVISRVSTEDRRATTHCPSPTPTPPAATLFTLNEVECLL